MGKTQDALAALETPFSSAEDQCDAELLIAVHAQPEKQQKKKKAKGEAAWNRPRGLRAHVEA